MGARGIHLAALAPDLSNLRNPLRARTRARPYPGLRISAGPSIRNPSMANNSPPRHAGAQPPAHRPSRFTEEQLGEALRRSGGIHAEACRILHETFGRSVTTSQMGRIVAASPRLRALKVNIEDARLDYAESQLWRKIEAGDLQALLFYLKTKGAKRGYVSTIKHQGDPAKPIVATFDFKGVPRDQLRMVHATMSAAAARAAAGRISEDEDDEA